jgi:hypothetical protein
LKNAWVFEKLKQNVGVFIAAFPLKGEKLFANQTFALATLLCFSYFIVL